MLCHRSQEQHQRQTPSKGYAYASMSYRPASEVQFNAANATTISDSKRYRIQDIGFQSAWTVSELEPTVTSTRMLSSLVPKLDPIV